MAKAIIYSDEDVLAAQQVLRSKTARKVGKTRSQVVEQVLADDIRKALEQGYSLKDIKNILAEAGISVSIARMQAVLEKRNQAESRSDFTSFKKNTVDNSDRKSAQQYIQPQKQKKLKFLCRNYSLILNPTSKNTTI